MQLKTEAALWAIGTLVVVGGAYAGTSPGFQALIAPQHTVTGDDVCRRKVEEKWQKGYDAAAERYDNDTKNGQNPERAKARLRDALTRLQTQYGEDVKICDRE